MAIIYQTDKRSGITYAYNAEYHWDKNKQQSRSKRTLIGRFDKETGEILPTDGRMKKTKALKANAPAKRGPILNMEVSRCFYGATYLLDHLSEKLNLAAALKACFPDIYKQILSIVYYQILETDSPMSRFFKWESLHRHPFGKDIPSQRSTELFASITEEDRC
jgi:hypothetical protein